ncbi:MAG: methyltransferase domain-containing protein [Kofleriaceae bacterium]|nr:methyltransferase domain-containing protein [Kofleriaceae bacterium]
MDKSGTGAITDADYWDGFLDARAAATRIPSWHGTWGKHGAFLRLLTRHCGSLRGARVIELGGACSVRLMSLARFAACDAVALDFAPQRLAVTKQMFQANGAQVECVAGDLFEYRPTRPFDLVTHWGLLEHFERPAAVMEASARLLRPGGLVAFSMPNMEALGAQLWRSRCPRNWATHIFHSDSVVHEACHAAGLELTATYHWGPPMLQISAWERDARWLHGVTLAQVALQGLAKATPVFQWGTRLLSMERAFVARRRA